MTAFAKFLLDKQKFIESLLSSFWQPQLFTCKWTYINQSGIVAILDVVQHGGFIKACQFCHVFDFVEFRWIHFLYVVFKYHVALAGFGELHFHFIATLSFDAGSDESLEKIQD